MFHANFIFREFLKERKRRIQIRIQFSSLSSGCKDLENYREPLLQKNPKKSHFKGKKLTEGAYSR